MTGLVRDTFETGVEGNWESEIAVAQRGPFTDRDLHTYPIFGSSGQVQQVIIFARMFRRNGGYSFPVPVGQPGRGGPISGQCGASDQ